MHRDFFLTMVLAQDKTDYDNYILTTRDILTPDVKRKVPNALISLNDGREMLWHSH